MPDSDGINDDRPKPKFFIDKKQGLRHLLHSAIRMSLDSEDAFAINMLVQAVDKMMLDLLKHARIADPVELEDRIVPQHKKEFFQAYRKAFNFLKHADEDPHDQLPVYDLILSNEALLFFNIIRYRTLFSEATAHLQMFMSCLAILHPNYFKWQSMGEKGQRFILDRRLYEHMTRREAIKLIREQCYNSGAFVAERADDLKFVDESNHVRLSGKPGPRRFRIPMNDRDTPA